MSIFIPADVPKNMQKNFQENYNALSQNTDNIFIFSCDQKIEHLNDDFYGPNIDPDANDPEHFFRIASNGFIGGLATQLGIIAKYGNDYPEINYVVKLNSKTNIIPKDLKDPISSQLWTLDNVLKFKQDTGLKIRGVGYTIYLGSEYENIMLKEAAQIIFQAHQHGLITILWAYPRGKNVKDEKDFKTIAGAAGVATCLGADFVKIHLPSNHSTKDTIEQLKIVVKAAGKTKVICAGGEKISKKDLLKNITEQITVAGTAGSAIGRNIFQNSLKDAVELTKEIFSIIYKK